MDCQDSLVGGGSKSLPWRAPWLAAAVLAAVVLAVAVPAAVALAVVVAGNQAQEAADQSALSKAKADKAKADKDKADKPAHLPLFRGWPRPQLALVLTGELMGYIEPCGCAGLENQKGGLKRRQTFLKGLEADGWPVVSLDVGGLIHRFGRQTEIKYQSIADAFRAMDYQAVGFGVHDLRLPAGGLVSAVSSPDGTPSRFVSANVALFDFQGEFTRRFVVIEQGGLKLGVTTVLSESSQKEINNEDVKFLSPAEGLKEILPELKKAECDHYVLLYYGETADAQKLAEKFPQFDLVVTASEADEPPLELKAADEQGQRVMEMGHKGMHAIVLGFFAEGKQRLRYQAVPLDDRFADSTEMQQVLVSYQQQLEQLGWEGLELRPARHPSAGADPNSGKFIGSQACAECHAEAAEVWENSPHSHATQTLTRLVPPRQFDPECISCHATGWQPQEYIPYQTGFESLDATPDLAGNGCENCHGPAAAHVSAEEGDDPKVKAAQRKFLHLSLAADQPQIEQRICAGCHDLDNDPHFSHEVFDEYWEQIAH